MSLLYGLNTGLTASIDLGDVTLSETLNDLEESVTRGNMIIGLTQAQFTALFDVSGEGGRLVLDETQFKNIIASVVNNVPGSYYTRVTELSHGDISADASDAWPGVVTGDANYNLADYIANLRDYLRPSTYINDVKNAFIATSLGTDTATISGRLADLRATYDGLGFFTDFDANFSAVTICGDSAQQLTADSVTVGGALNDVSLFQALADGGYLSTSALGTDLSLEDGFAMYFPLTVRGTTTLSVAYSADTSVAGGPSIANDLVGILAGTTTLSITKSLQDGAVKAGVSNAGGSTTDSVEIPVLLYKVT